MAVFVIFKDGLFLCFLLSLSLIAMALSLETRKIEKDKRIIVVIIIINFNSIKQRHKVTSFGTWNVYLMLHVLSHSFKITSTELASVPLHQLEPEGRTKFVT